MSWLATAGVFAVALAITLGPGALIAAAAGARGLRLTALAAPLTIATVGGATLAAQVLPFEWGVLPLIVATVVVAGLTWGVRAIVRRRVGAVPSDTEPRGVRIELIAFGAVLLAALLIAPRLIAAIGDPGNISQTFDNVYHLNAVRYIVDTGIASPMQQLIPGFYPDAWHALTAAIVLVTGAPIPVVVNVVTVVLGAVVWPLGCVLLVSTILGKRPMVLVAGAVISAGFAAFPLLMMDFGVLYPNVLSVSLLPAVLAVVVAIALRAAPALPIAMWVWILLMVVPAIALAHPSTLMALIAISFPLAVVMFTRQLRSLLARKARPLMVTGVVLVWALGAAVAAALLLKARPTFAQAFWPPTKPTWQAVLEVFTNATLDKPAAITVSVLLIAGIVAAFVLRRHRWMVASFAIIASLYIVCVSFPAGSLRYWLTGTWYSDAYRIASLLPVVVLPLATLGAVWLVGLLVRAISRAPEDAAPRRLVAVAGVAVVAVVLVASQAEPTMQAATRSAAASYNLTDGAALITPDEAALLERLPEDVPEGAVVAGSPWTGTSLSYVYADREALIPHIYTAWDEDIDTIVNRLHDAGSDPRVCRALERTGVRFVLDFGPVEVHGARHEYPGFERLDRTDVAKLVDSEGDARLYEITACA